jgi:hypothetical protein
MHRSPHVKPSVRRRSPDVPSNNASLWNPDQASARAGADPQAIEVSRGGQRRVLVVDDDEDVTSVLAAILETHGYEVTRLNRAVEALTAAIAADFDAIVCDMIMPGMPGDMFYVAVSKVKPHLAKQSNRRSRPGFSPATRRL